MKILMHMCCGPCAVTPVNIVNASNHQITGLYFNPNIHPVSEFVKRRNAVEELAAIKGFEVIVFDETNESLWYKLEDTLGDRCRVCYDIRLNKTFDYAKKNKFDAVTTSLLVSPYQNHNLIIEKSEYLSKKYNIPFYYKDFRIDYRQGQEEARKLGIYCQKYCGCILSLKERFKEISVGLK